MLVKTNPLKATRDKLRSIKTSLTVEPVVAAYGVAFGICQAALKQLKTEKSCWTSANLTEEICSNSLETLREKYPNETSYIQSFTLEMSSWQEPVANITPLIMVLFLGAYSDRHNLRKPFVVVPLIGEFFAVATLILCVIYMRTWPLEMVGISFSIIPSFFGATGMILMGAFSYVSDISTKEERTRRIGWVQITWITFNYATVPLGGFLLPHLGYIGILSITTAALILGLIYAYFHLEENPKADDVMENGLKNCILDIFNPKYAAETLNLLWRKKDGNDRLYVALTMVVMVFVGGMVAGEYSILFDYTLRAYKWDATVYSYYGIISSLLNLVGSTLALRVFTSVFFFHDLTIMSLSFLDKLIFGVILVLTSVYFDSSLGIYVASVVGFIQNVGPIGARSYLTKIVTEDDIGKAQSLAGICEAIGPMIFSPVYNMVLYTSLYDFPSKPFLVSCSVAILAAAFSMGMYGFDRRRTRKRGDKNEKKSEADNTAEALP